MISVAQIIILLQIALNLVISAQNPNVSETVKNQAIAIANQAITLASDYIAKSNEQLGNVILEQKTEPIKPIPSIGRTPEFVIGEDALGYYIDIVSSIPLVNVSFYKSDGDLIDSFVPTLHNTYSDGFHYITPMSAILKPQDDSFIYFKIYVKSENGAEYTSPLWRASQKRIGNGHYAEQCKINNCD